MQNIILASFCIFIFSVGGAYGKQFGLVVGIDDYKHFLPRSETPPGGHTDLQGAANDAKLIAKTLRANNVDLPDENILINADATTDNFLAAFDRLLNTATPGDTLIITFAGHGGQESEVAAPLDEKDKLDETLMFFEFDPKNPRKGRLNDDQIREKLISARKFNIILVMDSCHSGGLERSVNSRFVGASRNGGKWNISVDPLLDEIVPKSGDADKPLAHVTQILATETDKLLVTETRIDGMPHGALSYFFAQGISGKADGDKNKFVSRRELSNYIETQVVAHMNQNQKPRFLPRGDDTVAFQLGSDELVNSQQVDVKIAAVNTVDNEQSITVNTLGIKHNFVFGSDVSFVSESADLTFERNSEGWAIYNHTGDRIYHLLKRDELGVGPQQIVARTKLLKALHKMVRSDLPLGKVIARQSPKLQLVGSRVKFNFVAPSQRLTHLTAFNLAGSGEFQYLYPQRGSSSEIGANGLLLEFEVAPPAGADQLIGLYCDAQPTKLQQFLLQHNGGSAPDPLKFANLMQQTDCQIGRIGLFTRL